MNALIIEQNGNTSLINIKNISRDNLYKKCNYRKNTKFKLISDIEINKNESIELWGKENTRDLNLFKFDTNLNINKISGACILIKSNKDSKTILEISEEDLKFISLKECDQMENNKDNISDINEIEDYNSELEQEEYLYTSEEEN